MVVKSRTPLRFRFLGVSQMWRLRSGQFSVSIGNVMTPLMAVCNASLSMRHSTHSLSGLGSERISPGENGQRVLAQLVHNQRA